MIDLHCHILAAVDDGAPDLEAAIQIATALTELGYHTVAASPHLGGGPGGDVPPEAAAAARGLLTTALAARNMALRVLANAEHHLVPDLLQRIETGGIVPIGGNTNWLLVELPWSPLPMLEALLFHLQARDFRLLLAHPERHTWLDPVTLSTWIARGVRTQAELGSCVGAYGAAARTCAFRLVEQGLVHVLASDIHRPEEVQTAVGGGMASVAKHFGQVALERGSSANPAAILRNAAVTEIPPLVEK